MRYMAARDEGPVAWPCTILDASLAAQRGVLRTNSAHARRWVCQRGRSRANQTAPALHDCIVLAKACSLRPVAHLADY